jgi:hypothetical protein
MLKLPRFAQELLLGVALAIHWCSLLAAVCLPGWSAWLAVGDRRTPALAFTVAIGALTYALVDTLCQER